MLAKTFVISLCSFLFKQNQSRRAASNAMSHITVFSHIFFSRIFGSISAIAIIFMLGLNALSAFSAPAQNNKQTQTTQKKQSDSTVILVVGDSISSGYGLEDMNQGWVFLLQERLNQTQKTNLKNYRVINASIAGDTAIQGLNRLPRLLERHKPNLVIIELGGNDGLRGLAINQIQKQLADMIVMSQKAQARVLLLGMKMPSNYSTKYTKAFETMYVNLAKQHRIALVPWLFRYIGADSIWFQKDGIHPNAAAQIKLLDAVWPVLQPLL